MGFFQRFTKQIYINRLLHISKCAKVHALFPICFATVTCEDNDFDFRLCGLNLFQYLQSVNAGASDPVNR